MTEVNPSCPRCKGQSVKNGQKAYVSFGKIAMFRCKECGHVFRDPNAQPKTT